MKEKEIRELLLKKEGIAELNEMQNKMLEASAEKRDIILLSPTGSGKTVAFGVPLVKMLREGSDRLQAVIIAPSRELVIQTANVINNISGDFRIVALYGGHKVEDEINSLKVTPDVIVATPGRLLDHIIRRNIDVISTRILILDEFDKSLELGFEEEMSKIIKHMKNLNRIILTSATNADTIPNFLPIKNPITIDFSGKTENLRSRMSIRSVRSDGKDKLDTLMQLLKNIAKDAQSKASEDSQKRIGPERTIIFVNHRESAERVYEFLKKNGVSCALYTGNLDQRMRESALAAFNSGSRPVLVATDLAARGIDIEGVKNIIHYHLPLTPEAYTHRNGRTARVDREGNIYVILGPEESAREYMNIESEYELDKGAEANLDSGKETLYIDAGKREKLSKGDVLGFLTKDVGVEGKDVGLISVFDHYCLVTVSRKDAKKILEAAITKKIKGQKRRISKL